MISKTKLSIITINLNNLEGLHRTLVSVINQTCNFFEYIIIDGGSSDGSVEFINSYDDKIDFWISKTDNGIYHAMNEGIEQATGEYLLFLNSGDYLYSNKTIEHLLNNELNSEIIACDLFIKKRHSAKFYDVKIPPEYISAKYLINDFLPHPSTLIKKELFRKVGKYSQDLKIVADWEFFLKAFLINRASYKHLSLCVSVFISDGFSSRPEFTNVIKNEKKTVLKRIIPYSYDDIIQYSILENNNKAYIESLEFEAVSFLKKTGIVLFMIFTIKVKRKLIKLLSLVKKK